METPSASEDTKGEKPLYTSDEKTVFNVYNKCDLSKKDVKPTDLKSSLANACLMISKVGFLGK